MRTIFAASTAALAMSAGTASADVLACQDFNGISSANTETFDMVPNNGLLTNAGSQNTGGGAVDWAFTTVWQDTRGEGTGPVTAANDTSDFIGVNSFAGSNSPDVAADGTAVAAGVEHNYEFNDGDGRIVLGMGQIDTTGFTNVVFELDVWINDTGYETGDEFFIDLFSFDNSTFHRLVTMDDNDLEANASADDGTANWLHLSFNLDALIAANGPNVGFNIVVDNNSGSENIFVDNLKLTGVPAPGTLALLGLGGLAVARRRR